MSIEPHTFQEIMNIDSETALELVNTVVSALALNLRIGVKPEKKILVACAMLFGANTLLEQCGCKIKTTVSHIEFDKPLTYATGVNDHGEFS